MLENANRIMQESGTAAGVSRRLFLGAAVAGATLPASAALGAGLDSARTIRDAAAAGMSEDDFWACVRGEFLISDELAYMNSGTLGPMPKAAYYAVVEGYRGLAADPGRNQPKAQGCPGGTAAGTGGLCTF